MNNTNKIKKDWTFLYDTINFFDDLCIAQVIDEDVILLNNAFSRYFSLETKRVFNKPDLIDFFEEFHFTELFEKVDSSKKHIIINIDNKTHRFNRKCTKIESDRGSYYLLRFQPLIFTSANASLNSSKFLQLLMDNIPQHIFWKDQDSVYLGCNENFGIAAGFSPSDIIGKSDFDLPWTAEQTAFFRKMDREVMENQEPRMNMVTQVLQANGITSWARSNKVPLMDGDKVIGILGTYEDITERKLKEEIIDKQVQILTSQKKELENFAHVVAHDMKTPLRTIISFSQLLQRNLGIDITEETEEYLEFIISGSRSLNQLIEGILQFTNLNQQVKFKQINVSDLLNSLIFEIQSAIDEKNVFLNIHFSDYHINGNFLRLKQVFQNLILNAIKFTTPKVQPLINIRLEDKDTFWQFSVQDNGIGIEEEYKDKIFQMFQKLNTIDKYEGSGIGLAICKKIVNAHQGEIWLESEIGKGTTFYFTIAKDLI